MRIIRLFLPIYVFFAALAPAHGAGCDRALESRVSAPVSGLWASIPVRDVDASGIKTETSNHPQLKAWDHKDYLVTQFTTDVSVGDESGYFQRSFDRDKQIMWAESADLQLRHSSRWARVPGIIPLVKKKGVPIQLLVTLMHMKMAGIEYGSLKHVWSNISNERTQGELNRSPEIRAYLKATRNSRPPNEMIARWFHITQTYDYFETFLTQSGHRITNVRVETYASVMPGVGDFSVYLDVEPLAVSN